MKRAKIQNTLARFKIKRGSGTAGDSVERASDMNEGTDVRTYESTKNINTKEYKGLESYN